MKKMTNISGIKKIIFAFITLFFVCSVKLCANEISAEQALVLRQNMVTEAKKYIGCPYVLGATGPDKFDCSGLIFHVAREGARIQLPRTAKAIFSYCSKISDAEREAGDLVFFSASSSSPVNHVGIYIGNNQFISAVSDGPNTGVILSSLKESYWKTHYVGAGRFLPSGSEKIASSKPKKNSSSSNDGFQGFLSNVTLESSLYCDWSLFLPNTFMPNFRGVDLYAGAFYNKNPLKPGIGTTIRINAAMNHMQIPILFSLAFNDYFRFYAGPVITMGTPKLPKSNEPCEASFFPGIIGISINTPSIVNSKWKLQFVQDISYTVYNKPDGSVLPFTDSVNAGLLLQTGVRVLLPMSSIF
ncbi:MAG: C40 family peptidase [Treponema sp.]|nr:C40 family peptidase [Treponema sp.]